MKYARVIARVRAGVIARVRARVIARVRARVIASTIINYPLERLFNKLIYYSSYFKLLFKYVKKDLRHFVYC